jgi:hypothetical protein
MDLNSIKQIDIKKNFGLIVFLLCINAYIIMSWHNIIHMQLPYESTSSLNIDGANFSPIANAFGSILNSILLVINMVINFILTFVIVLAATTIFNKLYFKSRVAENPNTLSIDIKIITILFSICAVVSIMLLNKNLALILGLLYYIPFPIVVYFLTKGKIRKLGANKVS